MRWVGKSHTFDLDLKILFEVKCINLYNVVCSYIMLYVYVHTGVRKSIYISAMLPYGKLTRSIRSHSLTTFEHYFNRLLIIYRHVSFL